MGYLWQLGNNWSFVISTRLVDRPTKAQRRSILLTGFIAPVHLQNSPAVLLFFNLFIYFPSAKDDLWVCG